MNEQEMLAIIRNDVPDPNALPISRFRVATFFLRLCMDSRRTVAVFLGSGIKLTGRVLAFDEESVLFTSQSSEEVADAQLILLANVSSIRPFTQEDARYSPMASIQRPSR